MDENDDILKNYRKTYFNPSSKHRQLDSNKDFKDDVQKILNQESMVSDEEYSKNTKLHFKAAEEKLDEFLKKEPHQLIIHRKNLDLSNKLRKTGNEFFRREKHDLKIHENIFLLYTKSIALAEENSEELAFGYGNRSAFLMHLKKYKECLIDIDRAYEITKSVELKKKLIIRKHDCLLQLGKLNEVDQEPPPINFKRSKEIPCASELVKLEYNERYGRHAVAAEDIQPGTVIAIEKGFALFSNLENQHVECSHCLSPTLTGIPCHCCATVIYCSNKCKEEAWQQYHDIECPVLPYLYILHDYCSNHMFIRNLTLTIRLFIKFVKMEGWSCIMKEVDIIDQEEEKHLDKFFDNKLFQSNKFRSIYNLADCQVLPNKENHILCFKVIELLQKKTKIFDKTEKDTNFETADHDILSYALSVLKKLRNIIEINRNRIIILTSGEINMEDRFIDVIDLGVMISPFFSLFNHNCIYNVEKTFTKNQEILLFTTNFVPKGQQLFINYGTCDTMTREETKHYLKNVFKVICDCQACAENWSVESMNVDIDHTLQVLWKLRLELGKDNLCETMLELLSSDLEQLFSINEIFEKVKKLITIINKNSSGFETYVIASYFAEYIVNYYNSYAVKYSLFNYC